MRKYESIIVFDAGLPEEQLNNEISRVQTLV